MTNNESALLRFRAVVNWCQELGLGLSVGDFGREIVLKFGGEYLFTGNRAGFLAFILVNEDSFITANKHRVILHKRGGDKPLRVTQDCYDDVAWGEKQGFITEANL